jgi:hypothetical protein
MPFFATLDMHELVVRQIEADDEHYLLDAPLVLFNTLGTALEGEVFLDLSIISQSHVRQNYVYLKLPKANIFP